MCSLWRSLFKIRWLLLFIRSSTRWTANFTRWTAGVARAWNFSHMVPHKVPQCLPPTKFGDNRHANYSSVIITTTCASDRKSKTARSSIFQCFGMYLYSKFTRESTLEYISVKFHHYVYT